MEFPELHCMSWISLTIASAAAPTVAALISAGLDAATRLEEHQMQPTKPSAQQYRRSSRRLLATTVSLAMMSAAATAAATTIGHRLELDTTMFAAQVGSMENGGSVYSGALVDPMLGHGASVFSTTGKTTVRITFHEFFTQGSIDGSGSVTLVRHSRRPAVFNGSLEVSGGTAAYADAHGRLTVAGTITKTGMVHANLNGTITY
jgi:hypothetical protein